MRKGLYWLFGAILAVGVLGTGWKNIWQYIFGGSSGLWSDIVNKLQALDQWLIDLGLFPTMIAIGVTGLSLTFAAPYIWNHFSRYARNRRSFEAEFRAVENQRARQGYRWNLEAAFRRWEGSSSGKSLVELIDRFKFPSDFPPWTEDGDTISEYAERVHWPDPYGQELWSFQKAVFNAALTRESALLPPDRYAELLESRRVAAKFWDDWARSIILKSIRRRDISNQIRSNQRDIKLMAMSELALSLQVPWDRGPGKTPLFLFASDLQTFGQASWFRDHKRWCERLKAQQRRGREN